MRSVFADYITLSHGVRCGIGGLKTRSFLKAVRAVNGISIPPAIMIALATGLDPFQSPPVGSDFLHGHGRRAFLGSDGDR